MRRRRVLSRGGIAVLLAGALLAGAQSSQAEDEPEWYAGLPDTTFGNWTNASQGSMSYAKRAKQWFISPQGMVVAEAINEQDPDNIRRQWIRAEGYFVSPTGAPANYGYLEPMTVRSVGFGLMPVEATVQVSQRFVDGYPSPVRARLGATSTVTRDPDTGAITRRDIEYHSITVEDSFNVRVLSVRVDGMDMGLNGDCRTIEPAPVKMATPSYVREDTQNGPPEDEWFRSRDPSTYFQPFYGGELNGSMTIPPFTGCTTTAGDDLSRLLTLAASGPDNPVVARAGWPCAFQEDGANAPAPPGVSSPMLGSGHAPGGGTDPRWCPGVKPFAYPARENR